MDIVSSMSQKFGAGQEQKINVAVQKLHKQTFKN